MPRRDGRAVGEDGVGADDIGHGLAQVVPVDVIYADSDRAVPVGCGGYSSFGGISIRRDFREVVCIALRFAGSSSRPDQADEKVAVIVFVGQGA